MLELLAATQYLLIMTPHSPMFIVTLSSYSQTSRSARRRRIRLWRPPFRRPGWPLNAMQILKRSLLDVLLMKRGFASHTHFSSLHSMQSIPKMDLRDSQYHWCIFFDFKGFVLICSFHNKGSRNRPVPFMNFNDDKYFNHQTQCL